ncbi:MAG: ABC transporter permease [Candidatus Tectomicrobia bacterium]
MQTYILSKLMHAVGVALVISMVSFFLLFVSADPASMLLPEEADDEDIARFEAELGLDRPVVIQYLDFLRRVVLHGDLGDSYISKLPASKMVAETMWPTLKLAAASMLFATLVAVPVGVYASIRRYSVTDNLATIGVLVGQAMPLFWLGIMLIIIFGVWLRWLPTSGSDSWQHLILPAITLGTFVLPLNMRLIRSGMLEVLNQDYIRTARAKGLVERRVLVKHAFRNASIPLVTVMGVQFGALLGGAVVTETVFSWPGMGRLAVEAIQVGDFPVVQAVVLIFAAFTILANLAADIAAAMIDPRIRFG